MRRLVWTVSWVCVAVWSLFCAAAYGVFNLVGGWAARNADAFSSDPQTVEWVFQVLSWLHSLSTGAVLVGWGAVSLMILGVPWFLDRIAAGRVRGATVVRGGPTWAGGARDGVIDLAPDQYSVGPTSVGPGSVGPTSAPTPSRPVSAQHAASPAPRIPGQG